MVGSIARGVPEARDGGRTPTAVLPESRATSAIRKEFHMTTPTIGACSGSARSVTLRLGSRAVMASGQTMTEYAMIMSAVAIALLAGYHVLGNSLNVVLNSVDGLL